MTRILAMPPHTAGRHRCDGAREGLLLSRRARRRLCDWLGVGWELAGRWLGVGWECVAGERKRAEIMRIALFTETFLPHVDGMVTRLTHTVAALVEAGDDVL